MFRTRHDYFGKDLIRAAVRGHGAVETEAEVPAEARKIDLWFKPDATADPLPSYLGLLGRVLAGPVTVELCHNTPTGEELAAYIIKHGQFRRFLEAQEPAPPLPIQWVISSGRPERGIAGLRIWRLDDWPPGIYEGPPLLWTRLVVVSELEVWPETLLLRLMGKGAVFRDAVRELKALPEDAPERRLALPFLVRYRAEIPANPMQRTPDDQEFFMDTEELVEKWRQEAVREGFDKGAREGFDQGARDVLLRLLRRRFGAKVDGLIELRLTTAPIEQIQTWVDRVLTATTLAEVFAD